MRNRKFLGALLAVAVIVVVVLLVVPPGEEGPSATTVTTLAPTIASGLASTTTSPAATDSIDTVATTRPGSEDTLPGEDATSTTSAGASTPPSELSSTTTTTIPPAEDPDAGEEASDPVPLGESVEVGEWRIGVSAARLDATELVTEFVEFNEPPAEGNQYVLVELSGVYLGAGLVQPVFDWMLVSSAESSFTPGERECGVFPDSIYDVGDIGPDEQFTANVCFEVPSEEVDSDLLLTLGLVDASGVERFYSLD